MAEATSNPTAPAAELPLANPKEIKRIVFREVLAGDVKKFKAKSNTSQTGGGARDFRYRPYDKFDDVFGRILMGRAKPPRVRGGSSTHVTIYTGSVQITPGSQLTTLEFEPPTTARANEGRLTRLNALGLTVPTGQGRVFLLIWQTGDNNAYLAFATETQINSNQWHPAINQELTACLSFKRPKNNAGQGFVDFVRGSRFMK
jgi:hypothetical protein